MIAAWMVWSVLLAALLGLAARAVEAVLGFWRLPRRGIWLAVMAATATISTAGLLDLVAEVRNGSTAFGELWSRVAVGGGPTGGGEPVSLWSTLGAALSPVSEAISVAASRLPLSDTVLVAGWAGLVAVSCAVGLIGALRLWNVVKGATPGRVEGVPVLRTDDVGPAVWGVTRPKILWPRWADALGEDERGAMLLHEREHVSARDPVALGAGLAVAVALAWNPVVWWQYRRLRRAVEIDCDLRVLGRSIERAAYGGLLLDVAERRTRHRPLLALISPDNQIEERIRAMISEKPHHAVLRASALGVVALGLGLVACETPVPVQVHDEASPEGRTVQDGSAYAYQARETEVAVAEGQPLIVVDGEVARNVDELSPEALGLSPDRIERIHVYKGTAAVDRYGEEGADGVVEITTRQEGRDP